MWFFFHQKAYDVNAEKAFNYNGMFNVHLCIHNTHCCYILIHEKKKSHILLQKFTLALCELIHTIIN